MQQHTGEREHFDPRPSTDPRRWMGQSIGRRRGVFADENAVLGKGDARGNVKREPVAQDKVLEGAIGSEGHHAALILIDYVDAVSVHRDARRPCECVGAEGEEVLELHVEDHHRWVAALAATITHKELLVQDYHVYGVAEVQVPLPLIIVDSLVIRIRDLVVGVERPDELQIRQAVFIDSAAVASTARKVVRHKEQVVGSCRRQEAPLAGAAGTFWVAETRGAFQCVQRLKRGREDLHASQLFMHRA
eukprot:6740482-Prymnesium_polylepis.1